MPPIGCETASPSRQTWRAIWPINEQLQPDRHGTITRCRTAVCSRPWPASNTENAVGGCARIVRQYTDGDSDDHNLAFLLQLELNGLGRLGDDIDQTLERGIYGYRTDDQD